MNDHGWWKQNGTCGMCGASDSTLPCYCGVCRACLARGPSAVDVWKSEILVVCSDCGNKRCPKAENHINRCTRSNAPDQVAELDDGFGVRDRNSELLEPQWIIGKNLVDRAKMPGGWLIRVWSNGPTSIPLGITFIPDPAHEWDGGFLR